MLGLPSVRQTNPCYPVETVFKRRKAQNPRIARIERTKSGLVALGKDRAAAWKVVFLISPTPRRAWEQMFEQAIARTKGDVLPYDYRLVRTKDRRSYYGYVPGNWLVRLRRMLSGRGKLLLEVRFPAGKDHLGNVYAEAERLVATTNRWLAGSQERVRDYDRLRDSEVIRLGKALAELEKKRVNGGKVSLWRRIFQRKHIAQAEPLPTRWVESSGPSKISMLV